MYQTTTIPHTRPEHVLRAFSHALEAARAHEGATAPNPPVGCVLLDRAGQELAVGAHRRAGMPHAEIEAIASARARGKADSISTIVVTLEPCNHHGRTPPCVDAILATNAQQIWIACRDPNPDVAGRGAERLRAAGRSVHYLADLKLPGAEFLLASAERLLEPFAKRSLTGLPFVTIKQAVSSCGSMVPPDGQKTFTSPASLELAHRLRRRADAILTGSGTILADAPLFTVRLVPDHPNKHRMLVVLDRRQRVSAGYQDSVEQRGLAVYRADQVHEALEKIASAGGMEVLVEAGPTLTEHLLSSGQWDEHVLIEQSANSDGTDRVTIRRNAATQFHLHRKEIDVLGHN
ncbi:bifunctional diaminohydroxyphosphoribosylaminopyrimidine deaminase/5-amino-6-(5-phosphoribosylamino)uracil reductase RibD [Devosia sp. 1635]|uniref:bifunctional diaminohydroxyphosphoribosylaminopyrimidine deaminase/5-amino-6-(5-phosphoribosylamino)uracil reductase RibD n=1 Tax=Devosia sp. 1635 TaxID=2726066 RepID=UPI0015652A44|nr:bifunctional diaminohydroxyphosphoribosylaminopyrimidine deaminase/5-amino-6-(5-phosphoribosylamino)uracil reductase RibD [Devosia sp. 1635]